MVYKILVALSLLSMVIYIVVVTAENTQLKKRISIKQTLAYYQKIAIKNYDKKLRELVRERNEWEQKIEHTLGTPKSDGDCTK